jgi:hypothetical protein
MNENRMSSWKWVMGIEDCGPKESIPKIAFIAFPLLWFHLDSGNPSAPDYGIRYLYSLDPQYSSQTAYMLQVITRLHDAYSFGRCKSRKTANEILTSPFQSQLPQWWQVPYEFTDGGVVWIRDSIFQHEDFPNDFQVGDSVFCVIRLKSRMVGAQLAKPLLPTRSERLEEEIRQLRNRGGVVVNTVLIQANSKLFHPGTEYLPCLVSLTFDSSVSRSELIDLAHRLYQLKNQTYTSYDSAYASHLTSDERAIRHRRRRIPQKYTGEREIFAADLWIYRPYLSQGFVVDYVLPCLADPGESGELLLLPHSFSKENSK